MDVHHCSVSIGILTRDTCNIFSGLSDSQQTQMWRLFINLILATDMASHFAITQDARGRRKNWVDSSEGRFAMMQLLIKCADISSVARPFELADRWYEVLCEEFFREGELEKASGMEYSFPLNDREHLDRAKSQIGFYENVCFPLFRELVEYAPALSCALDQVTSNLNICKAREGAPG
jgi:hypothetical protein